MEMKIEGWETVSWMPEKSVPVQKSSNFAVLSLLIWVLALEWLKDELTSCFYTDDFSFKI